MESIVNVIILEVSHTDRYACTEALLVITEECPVSGRVLDRGVERPKVT